MFYALNLNDDRTSEMMQTLSRLMFAFEQPTSVAQQSHIKSIDVFETLGDLQQRSVSKFRGISGTI